MRLFSLLAVLTILVCSAASAQQTITYTDLVKQLTDLEGLAALPVPGEICEQWSSYDRASRYDEKTGKYVGWDANGDGGGVIRKEGDSFVFAEIEGPGCIRRIWSALPTQGHVRIYLDEAAEPVVDLPFIGYFDCTNPPFVYSALVHETAKGFNSYVPIPFQKSCRIVADKDWGAYYHFTYTKFPEGTKVPTFTRNLSAEETAALADADRTLRKRAGADPAGARPGEITEIERVILAPGETAVAASLAGCRAITSMWVKLDSPNAPDVEQTLRNVSLRIRWDGEKNPSVWSPLGDFFGTGPGLNKYRSLPLGVTDDGLYSYWYMPFAKQAVIEVANEGTTTFAGQIIITHAPVTRPIEQFGRFHAKWHRDAFLPTEPERWIDWRILKTEGRGRFLGVALEIWNPKGSWWGEGDEKFFVDGEKFPSTIGTGSEDYFGYAWCHPALFENAYHNQTRVRDNIGHVAVNRWHIVDNVPFQKSFEGDIEKYYRNERPTLYASTAYWYLEAGGLDPYAPIPKKDRWFYIAPKVESIPGAIEGESLKVLNKTGGDTGAQGMEMFIGGRWSGNAHLWWTQAKPGDKLDLAVQVRKSGKYTLKAAMTKAADYGIAQLYLDGRKLGEPIDFYNDGVIPTGEISLGTMDLAAGQHKLSVEIVGANEKAAKSYMFALDYLKLVKSK